MPAAIIHLQVDIPPELYDALEEEKKRTQAPTMTAAIIAVLRRGLKVKAKAKP